MPKEEVAILIIDDDKIIREKLESELKRNFFKTIAAHNGKKGLDIVKKSKVDIVLLDIRLKDIDGIEILSKIKKTKPQCEVIVITGYGTQDIAIQSIRRGAIDYIEKPIDMKHLTTAIGRAQENLLKKSQLPIKEKLLIIDDDKQTVLRLKKFLKKEGFDVFTAHSGKEGLRKIEKNKVDVLVTDINMSDMNGIEVLKQAKAQFQDIEGIMITGYKEQEWAIKALRTGAIDYITKPIDLEEFLISIKKALKMINLNRNLLFRERERKIYSEITAKELSKTQAQLFQTSKLATLGEMAAGLAHEINQPLGGISLTAASLKRLDARNKLTKKEIASAITDIEQSVKRMEKIINHIRTFARQDTLKFIEVDINQTISNALDLIGEQLRLHEIKVELEFDKKLPKVNGEPYQLEQVWINCLANAKDALDAAKETAAKDYKKVITISTFFQESKNVVIISIIDNGTGIPAEQLKKVFEPFYTTKEVGRATGLGLSISYGIIESHHGKIEIISKVGKGTRINIELPLNTFTKRKKKK
jgi:signal transduction histidine kinase